MANGRFNNDLLIRLDERTSVRTGTGSVRFANSTASRSIRPASGLIERGRGAFISSRCRLMPFNFGIALKGAGYGVRSHLSGVDFQT